MYVVVSTVKAVEKSAPGLCGVSSGLLISGGQLTSFVRMKWKEPGGLLLLWDPPGSSLVGVWTAVV